MNFSRRRAVLSLGALGAAPAMGASVAAAPESEASENNPNLVFAHGVASGDPLVDRVILWTRISQYVTAVEVQWQVALDHDFQMIKATGRSLTDSGRDYTIKVDVDGLKPATIYYYRFIVKDQISPVGQTRTLGHDYDKVVMAVASCSLFPNGYFNAYRAIANLRELDAVVHLGDYIYEYGAADDDYGMKNGKKLGRIPSPPHEIVSLSDYRMRHAQYRTDPDLQAAHARAPWICVFDDHEIANNPWTSGAQNHNPEKGEGDFYARKAAALKAWREWMPVRDPRPNLPAETIYRSFRFGKIAELVMLETRFLARTKELDFFKDLALKTDSSGHKVPDYEGMWAKINDPARELLGAEQRDFIANTLNASVQNDVTWQVIGNQVIMTKTKGPDIKKALGEGTVKTLMAAMPDDIKSVIGAMMGLYSDGNSFPWNLDAWDGYAAERERFYDMVKAAKARAIVVSGDSHTAWANNLTDANGAHVAVELGVTSITSPTRWLDSWLPDLQLAKAIEDQNEDIIGCDDDHNGFVRLTMTKDKMVGDWMAVSTIVNTDYTLTVRKSFEAKAEKEGVSRLVEI